MSQVDSIIAARQDRKQVIWATYTYADWFCDKHLLRVLAKFERDQTDSETFYRFWCQRMHHLLENDDFVALKLTRRLMPSAPGCCILGDERMIQIEQDYRSFLRVHGSD